MLEMTTFHQLTENDIRRRSGRSRGVVRGVRGVTPSTYSRIQDARFCTDWQIEGKSKKGEEERKKRKETEGKERI